MYICTQKIQLTLMFNPLKRIANDIETERMNATDLSDEAQPH
jgi:hypothetical protein